MKQAYIYYHKDDVLPVFLSILGQTKELVMATFNEKDASILIKYLTFGDDYDEAMKHFLSIAGGKGLIDQSDPLPKHLVDKIQQVYEVATNKINTLFHLNDEGLIGSIRFFYIKEFNFIHGMFMSQGIHGATIYFPNLEKGAFAIIRHNDPETHFVRITAFRHPAGEA